jgi:hypothetical protein
LNRLTLPTIQQFYTIQREKEREGKFGKARFRRLRFGLCPCQEYSPLDAARFSPCIGQEFPGEKPHPIRQVYGTIWRLQEGKWETI